MGKNGTPEPKIGSGPSQPLSQSQSQPHYWFPWEQQLDESLVVVNDQVRRKPKSGKKLPRNGRPPTLPGHPTKHLEDSDDLEVFLKKEFLTPDLNHMAPYLWLVSTQSHDSIVPLHDQVVRGRHIIITERPELHLVWIDDRIYIKPLPPYLTSCAFWEKYLDNHLSSPLAPATTEVLQPAVLGYLRSWTYLVQHESDFNLAIEAGILGRGVKHAPFMRFIANFKSPLVDDTMVSPRYRYGQLRLSRLNIWAKVFLKRKYFEPVYWQHWQYWQSIYGPLLSAFAIFSVILSAMQVGVTNPHVWPMFVSVSTYFSVVTLFVIAITLAVSIVLFLSDWLHELIFALRALARKSKKKS